MLLPNLIHYLVYQTRVFSCFGHLWLQRGLAIRLLQPKRLCLLYSALSSHQAYTRLYIRSTVTMVDQLSGVAPTGIKNRVGHVTAGLICGCRTEVGVALRLRSELILVWGVIGGLH